MRKLLRFNKASEKAPAGAPEAGRKSAGQICRVLLMTALKAAASCILSVGILVCAFFLYLQAVQYPIHGELRRTVMGVLLYVLLAYFLVHCIRAMWDRGRRRRLYAHMGVSGGLACIVSFLH